MGFSINGLLISLILLAPNLLFVMYPPLKSQPIQTKTNFLFTILEKVGQVGCFCLPVFSSQNFDSREIDSWFILMTICIVIYYMLWIRYFKHNRDIIYLYLPLGKIPIPMAIFPVLAFVFAAIWGKSVLLGIASILLAIGHFKVTWDTSNLLLKTNTHE
jgi:hypothetical protein